MSRLAFSTHNAGEMFGAEPEGRAWRNGILSIIVLQKETGLACGEVRFDVDMTTKNQILSVATSGVIAPCAHFAKLCGAQMAGIFPLR